MDETVDEWAHSWSPNSLEVGTAHVWLVQLDQSSLVCARLAQFLSPDEVQRAERFRMPRDRQRYVVAHGCLRSLVAAYLKCASAAIILETNPFGKPSLTGQTGASALRFNLSHSQEYALIGLTLGREIGVDIEYQRQLDDIHLIAGHFFAPSERAMLARLPEGEKQTAFYTCWARKEAFIKAIGMGLSLPLVDFAVTLAPDEPPRLLFYHADPWATQRWQMAPLPPLHNYSLALVVDGSLTQVRCWRWQPAPAA